MMEITEGNVKTLANLLNKANRQRRYAILRRRHFIPAWIQHYASICITVIVVSITIALAGIALYQCAQEYVLVKRYPMAQSSSL